MRGHDCTTATHQSSAAASRATIEGRRAGIHHRAWFDSIGHSTSSVTSGIHDSDPPRSPLCSDTTNMATEVPSEMRHMDGSLRRAVHSNTGMDHSTR